MKESTNLSLQMLKKFLFVYILLFSLVSCQSSNTLFKEISESDSKVTFKNRLIETENENVLSYEYFYNGGGVAAADFNNDGWIDLYFTGNQVDNKLFQNITTTIGEMPQFKDITNQAGVAGRKNGWKTGVTLADVNADGLMDIYVCYSGLKDAATRKNELYINTTQKNIISFSEQAEQYGLADMGYSTQASFFDFDQDGDLDCFVMNHNLRNYQRKEASIIRYEIEPNAGDHLFQNQDGKFIDISSQAGIKQNAMGFGLGLSIGDVNGDNYPDIYVANDYVEDDYLYINQRNGTFLDQTQTLLGHTSQFSMGCDIADLNNDAAPEIMTLDMLPPDNNRQKLLIWPDNWNVYQAQLKNGFWHQNMRNMLHLNNKNGYFSEIGQLAGVAATDWSWGVLMADFDLDGYKDIFVSNGLGRDYTNADFVKYYADEEMNTSQGLPGKPLLEHLQKMPSTPTHQYVFKNNTDLTFSDKTNDWGFKKPTISNGSVYADLDNDGDLEIITNNVNEVSKIYLNQSKKEDVNTIKIKLIGTPKNPFSVGTKVKIILKDGQQLLQEVQANHGFQSAALGDLIFGIPQNKAIEKIEVIWFDGKINSLQNIDKKLTIIDYKKSLMPLQQADSKVEATPVSIPNSEQKSLPFNNFDQQLLLPKQYSHTGPKLAVADVNNDGLEDFFTSGTSLKAGGIYMQNNGEFIFKNIKENEGYKNQNACFFDADGDNDLDLYIVNGDYTDGPEAPQLLDELLVNDGKGNFSKKSLPQEFSVGSCAVAFDIEKDGDLDLFVAGHVKPGQYPLASESFVLKNNGKGDFQKITIENLGILTAAKVIDLDKDGFQEIVLAGEFMPITILKNIKGTLEKSTFIKESSGWWNCLELADLDQDGDLDLIAGNLGLNSQLRASSQEPLSRVTSDFDKNGRLDSFLCYFIEGKSFPAISRDEASEQIPLLRRKLTDYQSFAEADIADMFGKKQIKNAQISEIQELKSCIFINQDGIFTKKALPLEAQFSVINAIGIEQKNGKNQLRLVGNDGQFRLRIGKIDAAAETVLIVDKQLNFSEISRTNLRGDIADVKVINKKMTIYGILNKPILIRK